jgi:alkyl hydroperoxide reductase subunit AhpC
MKKLIFTFQILFVFNVFSYENTIKDITGIDPFTKKNISVTLEKENQNTVIIFLSKDCPCSKGNLSYINKLSEDYPQFNFIGIHSKKGSTSDDLKKYIDQISADHHKINFKIIEDTGLAMAQKFEALKTPHAFIVDSKGKVVYNGGITSSTFPENAKEFFLKNTLEEIKNNRPISKAETKTLGCFITR